MQHVWVITKDDIESMDDENPRRKKKRGVRGATIKRTIGGR